MSSFFICCAKFLRSNSFCRNELFLSQFLTIYMHYKFNFSKTWIEIVLHNVIFISNKDQNLDLQNQICQPLKYFMGYFKKVVCNYKRQLYEKMSSYFTQDVVHKIFLLTNKATNTKYLLKTTKCRMYKNVMTQSHMSLPPQNLLVAKTCIISEI